MKSEVDRMLEILESAKDETGCVPMALVRQALKKLEPCNTKTENVLNSNWTVYGDRVKTELETRGITTRELADKLNITPITMCRYLKGERIPRAPIIAQTATALNVTCDYLIGLSDDPHKTSEGKLT